METVNRIVVKVEIYKWAIRESQKEIEEIKEKFLNIEKWIDQELHPTFKQLESLADYFKVPFGYMFLDKPPASNIMGREFRTIGNKKPNRGM